MKKKERMDWWKGNIFGKRRRKAMDGKRDFSNLDSLVVFGSRAGCDVLGVSLVEAGSFSLLSFLSPSILFILHIIIPFLT